MISEMHHRLYINEIEYSITNASFSLMLDD